MNAELLLREFDRLSEAPNAVSRCRQAILDLAVQGRLVRQLPAEDPMDDSLRTMSDPADSSSYGALPASWVPSSMSLVTTLVTSGSRGWAQYYAKTGAIFIRSQNVKSGALDLRDLARVSLPKTAEGKRTKLERGDLLIVITGDVGHVGAWEADRGEAYISQHIALARPVRTEFTPWLLLWLRAPGAGNGQLRAGIYGGKPGLNLQQVGRISLPLPPLEEQRRIVSKVDELMTVCDELETAQEQGERQRKQLSAASLARLTAPGDTPGEMAEKDVAFFLSHSTRMITRSVHMADVRRAVLDLAVQGQLHDEDARKWPRCTVAEVLDSLQTGPFGSSLHQTDYESGGTPVINPASIQDGRIIPIPKMAVGPATLDRLASFKVSTNDVVMARRGEMGRCAVVTPREHGWLCGTGCLVLHPAQAIFPDYLAMFIGAPRTRQYLNSASVGTTMQNLNQRILLDLEVVVPPFEEQRRIVTKVDGLMAVCDELERSLEAAQAVRTRALEAILHRVIEGAGAALPVFLEVAG